MDGSEGRWLWVVVEMFEFGVKTGWVWRFGDWFRSFVFGGSCLCVSQNALLA